MLPSDGSGFVVTTGDVRATASVFAQQAADLNASGGSTPQTSPATGDGVLDRTLSLALDTLGYLQEALGARVQDHSTKLGTAADNYDESEHQILRNLSALRP